MAEVNVENMEENAELFMEKMGFAHDTDGLDMTDAERAIGANEEFNRRVQEEQERMFNMNNPPVTSSVRPRLRSTQ